VTGYQTVAREKMRRTVLVDRIRAPVSWEVGALATPSSAMVKSTVRTDQTNGTVSGYKIPRYRLGKTK